MNKISLETFNTIASFGHGVPRLENGEVAAFKVGKTYTVGNKIDKRTLKVKCTQNCPYHLVIVV